MSFKLGDIVVDRVLYGVAENLSGELLYVLSQLADATIEVTAESKDAVDSTGTLIKRFWQGKTGTFTANNAMINLNILSSMSGTDAALATTDAPIEMPKIIVVKAGTTVTLTDFVDGTVKVNSLSASGTMGAAYEKAAEASETAFAITTEGVFTPPTDSAETQYIVKYTRKVKDGAVVKNLADKTPKTIKLTLKVLAVDPCQADTLKAGYVELPSFQPSPETSLSLTTDAQLEYKGDLQTDYCSAEKALYKFYWADEDEEDE
jgi:hypothetical protein